MAKFGVYPSYLFKDHDPILDQIDTLIKDAGVTYTYIQERSGVTSSTLRSWNKRKTKRPQFATVNAVARALDADLMLIRRKALTGKPTLTMVPRRARG